MYEDEVVIVESRPSPWAGNDPAIKFPDYRETGQFIDKTFACLCLQWFSVATMTTNDSSLATIASGSEFD